MNKTLVASTLSCLLVSLVAVAGCASKSSGSAKKTDTNGTSAAKATKGSAKTGPAASKAAGQTSGSTIKENQSQATDQGATLEDVTCDAEHEGTAWCGDEHTAMFCSDGHWYALDCASIGGDLCSETIDATIVDCNSPDVVE